MTDQDDVLLNQVAALDPTLVDLPPELGSTRYDQILERAMSMTEAPSISAHEPHEPPRHHSARVSHRRRLLLVGAAAAIAVVVAVSVVIGIEPGRPRTPAAALASAATNTGKLTTLRVHGTYDSGDGYKTVLDADLDGADSSQHFTAAAGSRGDPGKTSVVVIGGKEWTTTGGTTKVRRASAAQRNAPYQQASRAVVRAALKDSKITDLGTELVRRITTEQYRITLTPSSIRALKALAPNQLSAFELENPNDVVSLNVWIADDLIHRIHVRSKFDRAGSGSIVEFYDFGAKISIRPPA